MSRTAECLGLLPLVGRWTVDRLMVVYMNGVGYFDSEEEAGTMYARARYKYQLLKPAQASQGSGRAR